MKVIYRIEAWCECKDEATMNTITNTLINMLQTQKTNGNITKGNILKSSSDIPESTSINTGI